MGKVKWGVYLGDVRIPIGIGLITEESSEIIRIRYHEKQSYPEEIWYKENVRIFEKPQEAVKYLARFKDRSEDQIMKRLVEDFPKIFNKSS